MSAERLRELLSEATPGKWHPSGKRIVEMRHRSTIAVVSEHYGSEADARIIALAPDAIALLADMADHLGWLSDGASHELLLRLAALFPEDSA